MSTLRSAKCMEYLNRVEEAMKPFYTLDTISCCLLGEIHEEAMESLDNDEITEKDMGAIRQSMRNYGYTLLGW